MIGNNPTKKLSVFYNGLMLVNIVLFIVFLLVLSYLQYSTFRVNELRVADEAIKERGNELDYVLFSAASHVRKMRIWGEDFLSHSGGDNLHSHLLRHLSNTGDGYYSLDNSPPEAVGMHGNLFGLGDVNQLSPEIIQEQDMALWLMEMMKINHETTPYYLWSFYLSKNNFAANYPWVPVDFMISQTPDENLKSVFTHSYTGDNWNAVTPEANPERTNIWLDAYVDNSGKELVVTNVSPVYMGDEFMGAVAADIRLSFVAQFTNSIEFENEMMLVVNEKGQVLSRTEYDSGGMDDVPMIHDVVTGGKEDFINRAFGGNRLQPEKVGDSYYFGTRLNSAPWILVRFVPERDLLLAFLPTVKYYILIVLALSAFLWAVHFLIRENFVKPAIAFVEFIQTEMSTGPTSVPDVPRHWVQWFKVISDAMPFKAVSANLPGALYQFVRHDDGRMELVFISAGIKDLIGIEAEQLLEEKELRLDLIPKESVSALLEEIEDSRRDMIPMRHETPVKTEGGEIKWIRFIARPRRAEEHKIVWDGIALDITDLKNAEEELVRHRDHLEEQVDRRTKDLVKAMEELGALSRRVIYSHEEERSRLSRELHDGFGQQLTASLFKIIAVKSKEDVSREELEEIEMMIKDMTADLRVICRGLSPVTVDRVGLESAIELLVENLVEISGVKVAAHIETLKNSVDEGRAVSIYRVCQEAINNALKHSNATEIKIRLYEDGRLIVLEVLDNGIGFDLEKTAEHGLGITGMKQRAHMYGGRLEMDTAPGGGVQIRLVTPNEVSDGDCL